jgi:hypothetical protein
LHEVVALDIQLLGPRKVYRGGVVDHDVDAAELLDRPLDGVIHRLGVADVAHDRQGLSARVPDLLGCGVNSAGQLGVRLVGLGDQRNVGAVLGGAPCDRQPDPAAAAGDEDRLALQGRRSTRAHVRDSCAVPSLSSSSTSLIPVLDRT